MYHITAKNCWKIIKEVSFKCVFLELTVRLVGVVGAVELAVAALRERVAATLEAAAEPERRVAGVRPLRHRHVAEHQQARVSDNATRIKKRIYLY